MLIFGWRINACWNENISTSSQLLRKEIILFSSLLPTCLSACALFSFSRNKFSATCLKISLAACLAKQTSLNSGNTAKLKGCAAGRGSNIPWEREQHPAAVQFEPHSQSKSESESELQLQLQLKPKCLWRRGDGRKRRSDARLAWLVSGLRCDCWI